MQRLEVSGAVRPIYESLGVKRLRDRILAYRGEERCVPGFGGGGVPKIKRPLGRPRSRCKDNIKVDLQTKGFGHGLD